MIKKEGQDYVLYDKAGKKKLGTHPSKEKALEQERAIMSKKKVKMAVRPGSAGPKGVKRKKKSLKGGGGSFKPVGGGIKLPSPGMDLKRLIPGYSEYPYEYPYPYPSENNKDTSKLTQKGQQAPFHISNGEYPFPLPDTLKHGELSVDSCVGSCKFQDFCVIPKHTSFEEAEKVAVGCGIAEDYGCPVFLRKGSRMNFEELTGVEIFSTGTFRGHTFTKDDLSEIVDNFQKSKEKIKPPLVLGHDEEQDLLKNSGLPAAGWLTELWMDEKSNGDVVLTGNFEDVPDTVHGAVGKKAYKRISAEIYPNYEEDGKNVGMMLRRVALLGADVPEVKTLEDVVALDEPNSDLFYVFNEGAGGNEMGDDKDLKLADESREEADVDEYRKGKKEGEEEEKEKLKKKDEDYEASTPAVKNQDDEEEEKEKEEDEEEDMSEKLKRLEEELASSKKQNDRLASEVGRINAEKESEVISSFCETLKRDGKFLPAWEDLGLKRFIEKLDDNKTIKFSEASDVSTREFMMRFLTSLPAIVRFEELAKTDPSITSRHIPGASNVALSETAKRFMAESAKQGTPISFTEAVKQVARENPSMVE